MPISLHATARIQRERQPKVQSGLIVAAAGAVSVVGLLVLAVVFGGKADVANALNAMQTFVGP